MLRWLVNIMITSMIFFPDKNLLETPLQYQLIFEDVTMQTTDGVDLHGWYLKSPQEKGVILFFHGNAGNISHRLFKAKNWVSLGYSFFLVDYRGYGKSEGKINKGQDVIEDAQTAFRYLTEKREIPLSKIILYGESLGTYPAVYLATQNKTAALLLEAPFTSFVDLGKLHYPFVPGAMIQDFAFPNKDIIGDIKTPVFFIHGTSDEICPFPMAETLYELAPEPKGFLKIPGGTHNDLPMSGGEDYWRKPAEFLESYL